MLRCLLADAAVALDRPAAGQHHRGVGFLRHAGHAGGHVLKALAVGGADLGQKVNVAAGGDAAVQVAGQYALLLFFGHGPFIQVGPLVGLEAFAAGGLHQRHAELVQGVALARLLGIKDVETCSVNQNGKIRFTQGLMGAREWAAVSNETIAEGVEARVVAVEGNQLRIQAI